MAGINLSPLPTIVHVNGAANTLLDLKDRGLAYGDGLFETCRVFNHQIPLWPQHLNRLTLSLKALKISVDSLFLKPFVETILKAALTQGFHSGTLKIIVTRGAAGRGYKIPEAAEVNVILYFYPDHITNFEHNPKPVTLGLCHMRIGHNPILAGHKHLNRLENVLARSEWSDNNVLDSLLRDSEGAVIECTAHNLFVVTAGQLKTPKLDQCGVKGVMRELICTKFISSIGLDVAEAVLTLEDICAADAVFICNSNCGIRPVSILLNEHGETLQTFNDHTLALQLQTALLECVKSA